MQKASLTRDQASAILCGYPSLSEGLQEFGPMPQGLFNQNARLVVAGRPYVLKKMISARSEGRHRYGAVLQKFLADHGYPCPSVVANGDGDVITSHEGDLYSIQTWAQGSNFPGESRNSPDATVVVNSIGSALGRLHSMAMEAAKQGELMPPPTDACLSLEEMVSGVGSACQRLFAGSSWKPSPVTRLKLRPWKSPVQHELLGLLPVLKRGCRQLAAWNPGDHPSLTLSGPCHGDINWENLFFQGRELTAVLDFDNAMEMSPAYDAAAAAAVVCADNSEHLEAFMAGYYSAGGFPIDQEILPRLMLLKWVRSLLWQVEVAMGGGTSNDDVASTWRGFLAHNIRQSTVG